MVFSIPVNANVILPFAKTRDGRVSLLSFFYSPQKIFSSLTSSFLQNVTMAHHLHCCHSGLYTIISCLDYLRSLAISSGQPDLNQVVRVILLKEKSEHVIPLLKWPPLSQRQSQHLCNGLKSPAQHGTPSDTTDKSLPPQSLPASPAFRLRHSIPGDMPALWFCICFSLECSPLKQPYVFLFYLICTFTQISPSYTQPLISLFPFPSVFFSPLNLTLSNTLHILLILLIT